MSTPSLGISSELQGLSQAEQIYELLKEALMSGDIKPGQALAVKDVAAHFSVSAMPVREAITKLAAEGLLIVERKKAARVPELSVKQFREVADIRSSVEALAARSATPHICPEDLIKLTKINNDMSRSALKGDIQQYLRLNYEFHITIYLCCDMPILLDVIQRLMALAGPTLCKLGVQGMFYQGDNWHDEILQGIREGDSQRVADGVCNDIESSIVYIESLEEQSPGGLQTI